MTLSILVPCYNAENYINNFFSNIEQLEGFKNKKLFVLFYDDGSTDNTPSLLKQFEKKYSNVLTIYGKQNMGSAYARNQLIQNNKSDYFIFADIDDYLDQNLFEIFEKEITNDLDCIVFKTLIQRKNRVSKYRLLSNSKNIYIYICNSFTPAWNIVFKSESVKKINISFLNGSISEDWGVIDFYLLLLRTKISDYYTYTYTTHNSNSVSHMHKRKWEKFKQNFINQLNYQCRNANYILDNFDSIKINKNLDYKNSELALIKRIKLNYTYFLFQYFVINKDYINFFNPFFWKRLKKECLPEDMKYLFDKYRYPVKISFFKFIWISLKFLLF